MSSGWSATWNHFPSDYLKRIESISAIKWYVLAEEIAPTTGTPHIQLEFIVGRSLSIAAVQKKCPGIANIKPWTVSGMKSPEGARQYIDPSISFVYKESGLPKDKTTSKNYVEWGTVPLGFGLDPISICESGMSLKEFIRLNPSYYMQYHNAVDKIWQMFTSKSSPPKYLATAFNLPLFDLTKGALVLWDQNVGGLGKSSFARAHFSNPFIAHFLGDLVDYQPGVNDGIIFDDFDFNSCTLQDIRGLVEWEEDWSFTAKYVRSFGIPKFTQKIFTANERLFAESKYAPICKRLQFFEVKNKLF